MDKDRFDALARTLAAGASHRRLPQGSGAGLVGGLLAFAAAESEAARKQRRHHRQHSQAVTCRTIGQSCQQAGSLSTCCAKDQAGGDSHLTCVFVGDTGAKRCECDTGFQQCNGACVSTTCPSGAAFDPQTCGCGCGSGQVACTPEGGAVQCVPACSQGQVLQPDCSCACPSDQTTCSNASPNPGACLDCPSGTVANADTCSCGCDPGGVLCGPSGSVTCHYDTECAKHNQTINVNCCNLGFNPCQNPGQINKCH